MVLLFDRKVKRTETSISFEGKSKRDLLTDALNKIIQNPDSLPEIRYSLLKHAKENTKLSISGLDQSLESQLKKRLRKEGMPPLKTIGSRDVSIVAKRSVEDGEKTLSKKPKPTFERERVEKRKETSEEPASEDVSSEKPPAEEASEKPPAEEPGATEPISTNALPEEALQEYTEVSQENPSTLPSGAEPFEGQSAEQPKKLGDVQQEVTPPVGKTITKMGIDSDHDNGGYDIIVVDNGGDVVKRNMMQDVVNELKNLQANTFAKDMDLEPADIPLPEEEEFPPRPQEPLPEEDATMKDTPAVKKEENRRSELANIRNRIFSKVARNEAEFNQAMSGTRMVIRDSGEGLFMNLKQTGVLKRELEGDEKRRNQFVKERLKLQETDQHRRILELRMQAAADTVASTLEIYHNNSQKIVDKIKTNPANRSLITSSYRDPDTFNEIKYLTDANGDLILNEATGAPYIESISALKRDDAAKLIKQRRAVDGSDLASNYYPMYGKQAKDFFSKNEYSYLGRQFIKGKKLKSLPTPPNIRGRIQELLTIIGDSVGIEDHSIKEPVFKQWLELETLKNSYDNYTATADYQYEQDSLALDEDGKLIDENAMASAAKILQNITAQQLIQAMSRGQAQLGQQEQEILDEPAAAPAAEISDKQQEEGAVEEGQMDVQKDPEQVRQESVNLSQWIQPSSNSYNPPSRARVFEPTNFPAFGGSDNNLSESIWA